MVRNLTEALTRGGESASLQEEEKEARWFLESAATIAESNPRSRGEADKSVLELVFRYSPQQGMRILRTAHAIIPKHEPSNGDHDHAVYYRNGLYRPKEGPEIIVTKLPPNSNRELNFHRHPPNVIEYKASYQSGLVVVRSIEELEEQIIALYPRQVYASEAGEYHSIRNDSPNELFSFDIIVVLPEDTRASMARIKPGLRLPVAA